MMSRTDPRPVLSGRARTARALGGASRTDHRDASGPMIKMLLEAGLRRSRWRRADTGGLVATGTNPQHDVDLAEERHLYRVSVAGGAKAIGCEGIPVKPPSIKSVNVSSVVRSHQSH